jgi:hypothetical protein
MKLVEPSGSQATGERWAFAGTIREISHQQNKKLKANSPVFGFWER